MIITFEQYQEYQQDPVNDERNNRKQQEQHSKEKNESKNLLFFTDTIITFVRSQEHPANDEGKAEKSKHNIPTKMKHELIIFH